MMLFRSILLLITSGSALAQNLSVPTTWREPTNSRNLANRISISQNAINTMMTQLDASIAQFNGIGYWQAGNVWSAMANQDRITATKTNQASVTNNLNTAFRLFANYDQFGYFNDDALWWATAALYAYRAYADSNLLAHSVATWTHVSQYVITQAQATAGTQPNKDFTISATCNGATMAGGVFWRPTIDDTAINSITTGLYITLSAFLAEVTGNSTYTNAAILSANWMKSHNINANDILLDTVNAHDCTTSPANELFTYNSGKYIEGLSVLATVTGDAQWTTLMTGIIAAAVKSSVWEGSNGIITEGASPGSNNDGAGFKAVFIRGLHEAFTRSSANPSLQTLLRSYINVQYNALLELAANGTSYSSAWEGPPQAFTSWGQLAALDVLVSAIDVNN